MGRARAFIFLCSERHRWSRRDSQHNYVQGAIIDTSSSWVARAAYCMKQVVRSRRESGGEI